MILLKDFSIGFADKPLLEKVSTVFEKGKLTALIGRNGSGKSTLMKAISGIIENYSGEILIDDNNIKEIPQNFLAFKMAFVNTRRPFGNRIKCWDLVALGRSPHTSWHGKLSDKDKEIAEKALSMVGMTGYRDRYIQTLSDGECQKIMIARAIAQDTPIIILDEPTSFLDLPTRYEIVGLLKNLTTDQGKTIIFSTHELDIALEKSDMIALISERQLHNLPVREMIESGLIQSLFKTPDSFITRYLSLFLQ